MPGRKQIMEWGKSVKEYDESTVKRASDGTRATYTYRITVNDLRRSAFIHRTWCPSWIVNPLDKFARRVPSPFHGLQYRLLYR
jgi:hypothetical protein